MKLLLGILPFIILALSVRVDDEVIIPGSNVSYYLSNETYTIELIPSYQVPKNIIQHQIKTASTETLQASLKRYFQVYKRSLLSISSDDYQILYQYLNEGPPNRVDKRKRSIPSDPESGRSFIQLSNEFWVSYTRVESKKRDGIPVGTQLCASVPLFTQCDNSPTLDFLKKTLGAAINETRAEIDDIKNVMNARWDALAAVLQNQTGLIQALVAAAANNTQAIYQLSQLVYTQGAEMVHSDNILKAQLQYITYMVNRLSVFFNAVGSTDPRSVMIQPSLLELYQGFLDSLTVLQNSKNFTAIVSTDKFNFTEVLLPTQVVNNISQVNGSYIANFTNYYGLQMKNCMVFGRIPLNEPFYIYDTTTKGYIFDYSATINRKANPLRYTPSCISVFGFNALTDKVLAEEEFADIPVKTVNLSDCNVWLLKNVSGSTVNRLMAIVEEDMIPFYSNCDPSALVNLTSATLRYFSVITQSFQDVIVGADVNERHWVTANCYINLLPDWLGMNYYINQSAGRVLNNIPFGFRTKYFTVNTNGELSSTLQYVYTSEWVNVYTPIRNSSNSLIVSQIDELESKPVLLRIDTTQGTVIDASDSFFGQGNNGRDCVVKQTNYDDYIVDCNFQNDEKSYFAVDWSQGAVKTSGVARYTDYFNYSITGTPDLYTVTLKPLDSVDYDFYVQFQTNVCPKILDSQYVPNGCVFKLFYSGNETITFGANTLNFVNDVVNITVPYGNYNLNASGTRGCLIIACDLTNNVSLIKFTTPQFTVVSPNTNASNQAKILLINNFNQSSQQLLALQQQLNKSLEDLALYSAYLATVNFTKVIDDNPFQEYNDLRAEVDRLYAKIGQPTPAPTPPPPSNNSNSVSDSLLGECAKDGFFASAKCFFDKVASTLIVIGVVLIVSFTIYIAYHRYKNHKLYSKKQELYKLSVSISSSSS